MRRWFPVLLIPLLGGVTWPASDPSGDWALPNFAQRVNLLVTNPGKMPVHQLVTLPVVSTAESAPQFPGKLAIAVVVNRPGSRYPVTVVPSQADDLDGDGEPDQFEFPITLGPAEQRQVEIYYSTTLSGPVVYPQQVHASHAYGFNRQTAALESELIGYRTYGAFFLDVQARAGGYSGLYNDLVGFLAARKDFSAGKDVLHVGDTLGLGGFFLRSGLEVYRPPFNVPDYAHRLSPAEVPHYRVVADGPVRAIIEARLDRWRIGEDEVALSALYSIDADEEFARCKFLVVPLKLAAGHVYEVGVGLQSFPGEKLDTGSGRVQALGQQFPEMGPLGLALYYEPSQAALSGSILTSEGNNHVVVFQERLQPGKAVSGSYAVAAAWSGSGIKDLARHLADEQNQVDARVDVSGVRVERTPQPERIEGEAY